LHEIVHKLDPKKLNGVILKINFEKVYDKVKWSFLQQTLRMKDFSEEWYALIYNFLSDGSVAFKVNDDVGIYFQMKICLRKCGPYRQCSLQHDMRALEFLNAEACP
jgi:hypothetical protein